MGSSVSRTPSTLAELWQWVVAELDRLRRRRYLDTGSWVIQQDTDGDLVARHPASGQTVVLAPKPGGTE